MLLRISRLLRTSRLGAALACSGLVAGCSVAPPWDDFVEQYTARKDTVTLGAGNAEKVNEAIHTIDPVPANAANTQIPANGQRMAGAVERYKDVSKLSQAPRQITPTFGSQGSGEGGAGAGTGAGAGAGAGAGIAGAVGGNQ